MDASLGKIKAHLAGPAIGRIAELIDLINDNIKPPNPVAEQDVYIRAMYIVSDEVNSFGGRFPAEELKRLTELLVDSPVMVGHRKDRLPVARTFYARLVERDGKEWIKSYFYWLRSAGGAQDLKENIDGGIYKECSIGFTYLFPECSVCGKDIRTCRHEPLESYVVEGESRSCYFNYRKVERVLETSLVYRGAVSDTAMSKELTNPPPQHDVANLGEESHPKDPTILTSPAELELDKTYLVVPNYESPLILLTRENGRTQLFGIDGEPLPERIAGELCRDDVSLPESACGILIGYRGKERCAADQLKKYLEGGASSVKHLELRLLPGGEIDSTFAANADCPNAVSVIRHEYCSAATLSSSARRLMTRDGVRLWQVDVAFPEHAGWIYHPEAKSTSCVGYYRLTPAGEHRDALLEFCHDTAVVRYRLRQFHPARFMKGCRFIADAARADSSHAAGGNGSVINGEIASIEKKDEGLVLELTGAMAGRLGFQPIRINGRCRTLVYRLGENDAPETPGRNDGK